MFLPIHPLTNVHITIAICERALTLHRFACNRGLDIWASSQPFREISVVKTPSRCLSTLFISFAFLVTKGRGVNDFTKAMLQVLLILPRVRVSVLLEDVST